MPGLFSSKWGAKLKEKILANKAKKGGKKAGSKKGLVPEKDKTGKCIKRG